MTKEYESALVAATKWGRRVAEGHAPHFQEHPLSGEWAGGLAPQDIAERFAHAISAEWDLDVLCDAFEDGYREVAA